jgi:hypothetical protein
VTDVEHEDRWAVVETADTETFRHGVLGPYRLGPTLRRTAFGEVLIALHDRQRRLVELDLLDALAHTELAAPGDNIMTDLAHVVGLEHRHIATVVGSGIHDDVPYVVRQHRLGRTLSELVERAGQIRPQVAPGVAFAVAEACAFLSTQGPAPGTCSMGGLDPRDVLLGYDGTISLVGIGLQRARANPEPPVDADVQSCFGLIRELDAHSGALLSSVVAPAASADEIARILGRSFPEACAERRRHVGTELRRHFSTEIQRDRQLFGLKPLQ